MAFRKNDPQLAFLERLNCTATIIASPRTAATAGEFADLSELTGLKTFITSFAGHIAAEASR
jgi:hypothetical protein